MLSKETIEKFSTLLGVDKTKLENALTSDDEVEIQPTVEKTFTADQFESLQTNLKTSSYNEGKTAGQEMLIKQLKTDNELEFEGKSVDAFLDAYKTKVLTDADKHPSAKIKELNQTIEQFKTQVIPEKDQAINQLKSTIKQQKVMNQVSKYVPQNLPESITRDDALTLITNRLSFDYDDDGNEVVKRDGQVLKNDLLEPIGYKSAIEQFVAEKKWTVKPDGRGGSGNEGKDKGTPSDYKAIRSMSDMNAYFEKEGINPASSKARNMMREAEASAREAKEEFSYED